MSKNTGGPAFPVNGWGSEGMTLRDYFAAKAMQAIISRMNSAQYNYTGVEPAASDAYAFADAMLKEREK